MKRYVVISFISLTLVLAPTISAHDKDKSNLKSVRRNIREDRKDIRTNIVSFVKNKMQNRAAAIISGKITAKNGSTLTIVKGDKTFTVNTDMNTKFIRHFWGGSSLDEVAVGNSVNVWGSYTDDARTTVLAKLIRNTSIKKRNGIFTGEIKTKNSGNFIVITQHKGEQTVVFGSSTKFVNKNGAVISYTDVQVGHKVSIKGVWDMSQKKIVEVIEIRDLSL